MKSYSNFLVLIICAALTACGGEPTVNGRNDRAASTTMRKVMRKIPIDQRLEFEIAYWTTRSAFVKNREFLDTVDGKTAPEIIEMGQQYFAENKAKGIKGYDKYASWNDMVVKVSEERKATEVPNKPESQVDKANNVLYKLSNL